VTEKLVEEVMAVFGPGERALSYEALAGRLFGAWDAQALREELHDGMGMAEVKVWDGGRDGTHHATRMGVDLDSLEPLARGRLTGVERIAERRRDHEGIRQDGPLVEAALSYLLDEPGRWPWSDGRLELDGDANYTARLVEAGALIAAEIRRVVRG
jgi:hypothetical protein